MTGGMLLEVVADLIGEIIRCWLVLPAFGLLVRLLDRLGDLGVCLGGPPRPRWVLGGGITLPMPCSASAPSTKSTSCSVVNALSSTRRVRGKMISLRSRRIPGGARRRRACEFSPIGSSSSPPRALIWASPSPTWITRTGLGSGGAKCRARRFSAIELLPIAVCQQEDRDSDIAERIGEHQLCFDALSFVADDRDIAPLADLGMVQHIGDAALLHGQDGTIAMVRPAGVDCPVGHIKVGVTEAQPVGPVGAVMRDLGGAESDPAARMRLDQLAARLVQDAPVAGEVRMILHEQRQKRVAEAGAFFRPGSSSLAVNSRIFGRAYKRPAAR